MVKCIALVVAIVLSSIQFVQSAQALRLKLVENQYTEEQLYEIGEVPGKYSVVKELPDGSIDPNFKPIECLGILAYEGGVPKRDGTGEDAQSNVIVLSPDKFILVDYFRHDSIDYTWYLRRYKADGTVDDTFHLFGSTHTCNDPIHDFYTINPPNEIKYIESVKVLKDGGLEVKGEFISPYLGWSKEDARKALEKREGPGAWWGKKGILHLSSKGEFISFIPKEQ